MHLAGTTTAPSLGLASATMAVSASFMPSLVAASGNDKIITEHRPVTDISYRMDPKVHALQLFDGGKLVEMKADYLLPYNEDLDAWQISLNLVYGGIIFSVFIAAIALASWQRIHPLLAIVSAIPLIASAWRFASSGKKAEELLQEIRGQAKVADDLLASRDTNATTFIDLIAHMEQHAFELRRHHNIIESSWVRSGKPLSPAPNTEEVNAALQTVRRYRILLNEMLEIETPPEQNQLIEQQV